MLVLQSEIASCFIYNDIGVKRYFTPTDTYELLRCDATFAILKTFGFADFL